MTAWGRMFYNALSGFNCESESGLVRMFRVEYTKEYLQLKRKHVSRQTDRQTDRPTDRPNDRQTDRQADTQTDSQTDKKIEVGK